MPSPLRPAQPCRKERIFQPVADVHASPLLRARCRVRPARGARVRGGGAGDGIARQHYGALGGGQALSKAACRVFMKDKCMIIKVFQNPKS